MDLKAVLARFVSTLSSEDEAMMQELLRGDVGPDPVRISVYTPFVVAAFLALLAPCLSRRLAPRPASWALATAALVAWVSWLGAMALLAFSGLSPSTTTDEETDLTRRPRRVEA